MLDIDKDRKKSQKWKVFRILSDIIKNGKKSKKSLEINFSVITL